MYTLSPQAELQRAQLMQQVGDLLRREHVVSGNAANGDKERAAPPQQTVIQEQVRTPSISAPPPRMPIYIARGLCSLLMFEWFEWYGDCRL